MNQPWTKLSSRRCISCTSCSEAWLLPPSSTQQLQLEGNKEQQQQQHQQRLFGRIIKRNNRFLAFGPSGGDPVFAAVLQKHRNIPLLFWFHSSEKPWHRATPTTLLMKSHALLTCKCQHGAKCCFSPPDKDSPAREASLCSTRLLSDNQDSGHLNNKL